MQLDITDVLEELARNDDLGDTIDIRVVVDNMRSTGGTEPFTLLEKFTLEITQSRTDGEIVEY